MDIIPEKNDKKPIIVTILITGVVAFALGLVFSSIQTKCPTCKPEQVDFSLFWEAWDKLHSRYVNPAKLDTQKLIYGAIRGMVSATTDPYTVFMNPDETKRFSEDTAGKFEGVGMEIGLRNGYLQVISPIKGTPAEKAGIKAGDKIIKIGDKSTGDLSVEEAVVLIRGPKGTSVVLSVFRDGWDMPKDFEIQRAIIQVPTVEWEMKESDGQKIAYISLYQFSERAGLDFDKVAAEVIASPAQKIIFNLRNNPGGYLEVSQDIAGWFLDRGEMVVIEDRGQTGERTEYKAVGIGRLKKYPIVVLINQGTASASEILAGALRDNRGVQLIGEKSYGKGSVQQVENLSGNSSLKITIAKWLTPKGNWIDEKGLVPDVEQEITPEDDKAGKDPQLERAIEIIKTIQ